MAADIPAGIIRHAETHPLGIMELGKDSILKIARGPHILVAGRGSGWMACLYRHIKGDRLGNLCGGKQGRVLMRYNGIIF